MDQTGKKKSVVICGCGPAGVAAAVVFAKRGMDVKVYEKRSHPAVMDSSNENRAFVVILNARGRHALEQAGFDMEALAKPGTGVAPLTSMERLNTGRWLPWTKTNVISMRSSRGMVADRMSWVRELVSQAEGMKLGIDFHWNSTLEDVSLQSKTATFRLPGGRVAHETYDLLVGADGCNSKVRGLLEKEIPGFTCSITPNVQQYKVVRSMEPPESAKLPTLLMVTSKLPPDDPRCGYLATMPSSVDGKAAGLFNMHANGWEGLTSVEECERFLRQNYRQTFPEAWIKPVSEQLASRQPNVSGWRVDVSQLHGPSVVLIGDAGHGVTPMTGQGMNSALEDTWILSQVLEAEGGALDSVPEAFNAARIEDAHALLWLDRTMQLREGRLGRHHWRHIFALIQRDSRRLLARLSGGRVELFVTTPVSQTCMRYSEAKRRVVREDALTGAVLAGAAAVMAWGLWAAWGRYGSA